MPSLLPPDLWETAFQALCQAYSIHGFVPGHAFVAVGRWLHRSPDTVDRRFRRDPRRRVPLGTCRLSPEAIETIEDLADFQVAFIRLASSDPSLELRQFQGRVTATVDRRLTRLRARELARRRLVEALRECSCTERSRNDDPFVAPSPER